MARKQPRPSELMLRLTKRLGAEGLASALARARRLRDPLSKARSLASEGRAGEALAEVVSALTREPDRPTSPRLEEARAVLESRDWTAVWQPGPGAGSVRVTGPKGQHVADIAADSAVAGLRDLTVSITPTVRLKAAARKKLSAADSEALERLVRALYPLIESLRPQSSGREVRNQAEVHEAGDRPDVILRTTFACNQRCPFCFVPHQSPMVPDAELEAELDSVAPRLKAEGLALTVSGGEPLADPRLIRILESARSRGIKEFILQTNMVGLDRPGMVERLTALGVTGYDVSFHSHRAKAYDAITGSRGQHPRAVSALGSLLDEPSIRVTACILINKLNYRHLPELMGFLGRVSRKRRKERPVEVCFSVMNGAGMNRAAHLAVDLEEAAPFIWKALQRCKAEGITAQRFSGESSLPPCVVPKPEDWVEQTPFSQDRVRYAEDFSGAFGDVGRAKKPGCRACPYDRFCLGVPAEYARLFGLGALRPPRPRRAGPAAD
ncbi:MAG: radical SAM protein [Elusimicrobia bacterium]|nr:radical SAM protein [Elusimicrobiota bacterium]